MFSVVRRLVSISGIALAILPVAPPLWAQSSTDVEEVVVTARKRDETYLNVPVTIDVFTQQTIESAGIEKPADFIAMVPNMTMVQTQNVGNSFVVLRGISQARNSEPSVAVLVDGVEQTNPAQFNQALYDIQQIEVLKGPQGALYGRNAIGGAIIIRTVAPSDEFQANAKVGYGNENSYKAQLGLSGPMNDSKSLKYSAAFSYYNTDGFLENTYLDQKADPLKDYSGRVRMIWEPTDSFTGDLRLSADRLETRGFYFVIPRDNESNPFSSFTTPPDANNTITPITNNNTGEDNRDLWGASLKLEFKNRYGVLSTVSAWDKTKEIITGDAYDFRPILDSVFYALEGHDLNQSQYLEVESYSQEARFTANPVAGFSWIAGMYLVHTQRFISTGNMVDTGNGVFPVYQEPRYGGNNPSETFLADSQNQNAWALFTDLTYELTSQWEFDAAVRYDQDTRRNTTDTPDAFLPQPPPPEPQAYQGLVRQETWDKVQPKGTIRYKLTPDMTLFGGWSRGFRSGGFNQTGVGAVAEAQKPPILGVHDTFGAEVADTWEVGFKGNFPDQRMTLNVSLFDTQATNSYFFVFLAANSTQNLGNLDADYKGGEIELTWHATDHWDTYASYGYTHSKITSMEDPTVIGNQAPLVSRDTINAGVQFHTPLSNALNLVARVDYQQIGRTWWEPYNVTSRDPVNLVDARVGVESGKWTATAWSKNLTNTIYNAEYSPGNFLWKAQPRSYGVEFGYKF